jgi:hypothetical protein
VPAGGLVLAPEGYSTCICPYNYKTSLALFPVERFEDWSIYLAGRQDKRAAKKGKRRQRTNKTVLPQIKQLRLNFNAPGDRMDTEGHVWFAYPRPMGDSKRYDDTKLPVDLRRVEHPFRHNADLHEIGQTDRPWLFTSGVEGSVNLSVQMSNAKPREYNVQLFFAETDDLKPGDRVFDIKVRGVAEVRKFDIVARAGDQNVALSKQLNRVPSVDGRIEIELFPRKGKPPRICAILIEETVHLAN